MTTAGHANEERGVPTRHTDGQTCTCDPSCDCHPPERVEPVEEIAKRGSFHLRTCPAFALHQRSGPG